MISVIITTFNRSIYLEETLISIQNQTYNLIEIIVVDDGSYKDIAINNKAICDKFNKCAYYYKENSGQPDARNFGIKKSKGAYISFCDDDDFWVLNKLEKQLNILKYNTDFGLVTGCIEYIDEKGIKLGLKKCHEGYNHGFIFENLLIKNRTASITPLIRKEVFDKVGLFDINYTIAEDWEFWRRASYYFKFYFINEVLAYVRIHDENMSLSRKGTVLERYKLYKKLTKSLLLWGEERFSKKEKQQIEYLEWCHYRKLFSNNLNSLKEKIIFITSISKNIPYLLRLYFNYNKDYKIQK